MANIQLNIKKLGPLAYAVLVPLVCATKLSTKASDWKSVEESLKAWNDWDRNLVSIDDFASTAIELEAKGWATRSGDAIVPTSGATEAYNRFIGRVE